MGSSFSMPFLQLLVTQNIQARIFFQLQLPAVQQLQISSKHFRMKRSKRQKHMLFEKCYFLLGLLRQKVHEQLSRYLLDIEFQCTGP